MFIHLEQYQVIEVQGEDAEKFLQGQLTCDVTKLNEGESTLAAHCDAKGKMNSLFRLIRAGRQQFLILIKKSLLPSALNDLKKYAVFSKVTLAESDYHIVGLAGEKCGAVSASFCLKLTGNEPRYIFLNATPLNVNCTGSVQDWECLDIQNGIPTLAPETQNEFIPQALNLQCIEQAISFQKGCYIGQETVARAKYRGANKRAMYILKGTGRSLPAIGSEIEMQLGTHWRGTGTILSAVCSDGVLWLLAVLGNQLDKDQKFRLPADQSELVVQPLPYALAE
ncbi:folate-binding protein YgfZ [Pasteurellaceae bacterium LIM206]|nr:folate-binding protein YgfZ [Pasteurellaceae bacterium LIM206]